MPFDIIFLDRICIAVRIGTTEEERRRPQDVIVSLRLGASLRSAGLSDDLNHSVDYSLIESEVRSVTVGRVFKLAEALAETLAEQALKHDQILSAWVRVEKRVLESVECVGVEIWRERS